MSKKTIVYQRGVYSAEKNGIGFSCTSFSLLKSVLGKTEDSVRTALEDGTKLDGYTLSYRDLTKEEKQKIKKHKIKEYGNLKQEY